MSTKENDIIVDDLMERPKSVANRIMKYILGSDQWFIDNYNKYHKKTVEENRERDIIRQKARLKRLKKNHV